MWLKQTPHFALKLALTLAPFLSGIFSICDMLSRFFKSFYLHYIILVACECVCVWVHACHGAHVEVGEQLLEVGSPLPSHRHTAGATDEPPCLDFCMGAGDLNWDPHV